jgi:hypothetical protein
MNIESNLPQQPGRDPRYNSVGFYIISYDSACCYDGVLSYRYAGQYRSRRSDPHILFEMDGFQVERLPIQRIDRMIFGNEVYLGADLNMIFNDNAAEVEESAGMINKHRHCPLNCVSGGVTTN